MLPRNSSILHGLLEDLYKLITICVFLILPSKVTKVFVSLSIIALIYRIKDETFAKEDVDIEKFNELLRITFADEILLLPEHTIHWFWEDEFLDRGILVDGEMLPLRKAIKEDTVLLKHMRLLIDKLLDNVPKILKYKLRLSKAGNRVVIKHNVISLLLHHRGGVRVS